MIAMMLDPRVRSVVIPNYDEKNAENALRAAFLNFPATLADFRGPSAALRHGGSEPEDVKAPEPKRPKLLQMAGKRATAAVTASELDLYLKEEGIDPLADEEDQCPLRWWRERQLRFPVLYEMARVYLAVPASSAPSERVFSVGGLVLTDKRRQLLESRVAKLMFMKRNMALYTALTENNTKK